LSHSFTPFYSGYFRDRVPWSICLSWPPTVILLVSASQVVRITGVSHHCCRSLLTKIWDSEANSMKQRFIVPAQTQQTHVQRLRPENKGVSPYTPLQAGYRSKKQGLIHIWLYLILLATLP
jgi:hypothetical protein